MEFSSVPFIIDGPNFISRILDLEIDKDIIANQISLNEFRKGLNCILEGNGAGIQVDLIEFVCSKKLFGQSDNKFTQGERDSMIQRFQIERGVHVEEVILPGSSEKGVDTTIASMLEFFSKKNDSLLFFSHDRDFVPVLKKLREKGIKTYLVALNEKFPRELSNEAYQTIWMHQEWRHLFTYSYPRYNLEDNFSLEKFRDLVSNTDDRERNQLMVFNSGEIYYTLLKSGKHPEYDYDRNAAKFYFESCGAFNGYAGPQAASDRKYLTKEYKEVVYLWRNDLRGYRDYNLSP